MAHGRLATVLAGPHLVVDISAHGFGHLALTAPVLHRLAARIPLLQITIRSSVPAVVLRDHLRVPFRHLPGGADFGMVMRDALHVDVAASAQRYAAAHADWDLQVDRAAAELQALAPTLLLANIPYLSLAAARRAGVPAFALCCLHWADIFAHYCGREPGAAHIEAQMRDAYASAITFLAPRPSMPMEGLAHVRSIGPIARVGRRLDDLAPRLGIAPGRRVALLSLGGVPYEIDVSRWPVLGEWVVIAASAVRGRHASVMPLEATGLRHPDLMASCDAVIAKPGYGTIAEAAVNGVPVSYVSRGEWPEEPGLVTWLQRMGRCAELSREDLLSGRFEAALNRLAAEPVKPPVQPTGADEAADVIEEWLRTGAAA
ncbi:MAG: hypothetical protein KIT73_12865 [Burkholderiales bacterium]|nr:hypothetical protein [Burkholderiales bacterium]